MNTNQDNFTWTGDMIEEYDENCEANGCVEIFNSPEFSGWSQINLSFTEEGVYQFNTSINECPDYGDSIEITVSDSCSNTTIKEYQQNYIYSDANNNLIFNLNEEFKNGYLEIFDLNGKKIIQTEINKLEILSLDKYQAGIYNVRLLSPNLIYNTKIIIL